MFLELEVTVRYDTNENEHILMKNVCVGKNLVTSMKSLCRL